MPRRGFSMLEVIIASVLFLSTIGGVLTAVGALMTVEEHQRRLTTATALGEQAMEELLLRWSGHADVEVGATRSRFFSAVGAPTTTLQPGGYEVRWSITRVDTIQNLKDIDLQVRWTESTGPQQVGYFTWRP